MVALARDVTLAIGIGLVLAVVLASPRPARPPTCWAALDRRETTVVAVREGARATRTTDR